jgi:hypothetical protein
LSAVGGSGRRTREGREEEDKGGFVDSVSVSVQAIKADERSEKTSTGFVKDWM